LKLEHYIAATTAFSRRQILDLLVKGEITVNNDVVEQLTHEICPGKDMVCVQEKVLVEKVKYLYYKVNKPMHIITTFADPKGRTTLKDAFPKLPENVFPVGRLDRKSTGLLIFTNDGAFSDKILRPKFNIPKLYTVELDIPLKDYDRNHFKAGIMLEDGPIKFLALSKEGKRSYSVTIDEGRNRIVRRAFDFLDYTVRKLERTAIGNVTLGPLKPGEIKALTKEEIDNFK
jgi:23S rRNA pseudouridine2605 synthase